jgi:hypothetical protein
MKLLRAVLGQFFPSPIWQPIYPAPVFSGDVNRFAGSYRSTRRNETSLGKLQELFSPVTVQAIGPGILHASGLAVVPQSLWIQTETDVFRDQSSPEVIPFRETANGCITHLFEDNFPVAGYTRLPWYGVPELHYWLLALCVPLFPWLLCLLHLDGRLQPALLLLPETAICLGIIAPSKALAAPPAMQAIVSASPPSKTELRTACS